MKCCGHFCEQNLNLISRLLQVQLISQNSTPKYCLHYKQYQLLHHGDGSDGSCRIERAIKNLQLNIFEKARKATQNLSRARVHKENYHTEHLLQLPVLTFSRLKYFVLYFFQVSLTSLPIASRFSRILESVMNTVVSMSNALKI